MYRFIECTVEKYMTRAVRTVTRRTTMRELEALFEKYDFNSFPVVEEGKMFRDRFQNSIFFGRLPSPPVRCCPDAFPFRIKQSNHPPFIADRPPPSILR
jgi:CBS domain-containing protein